MPARQREKEGERNRDRKKEKRKGKGGERERDFSKIWFFLQKNINTHYFVNKA